MRRAKTIILALLAVAGFVLLLSPPGLLPSAAPTIGENALALLKRIEMPSFKPADESAGEVVERRVMETVGARLVEGKVRSGETIEMILRRSGMSASQAYSFVNTMRTVFDPRKAQPGDQYRLWIDGEGEILKFNYKKSPVEIYEAERASRGWVARKLSIPIQKKQASIAGVLEGSLWESFSRAGGDAELIMGFVELFSWDIDFSHDSHAGDEFRVVYEVLYADGQPIGNGRILAASYRDNEGTHSAFYWNSPEVAGYFDMNGNSIRKNFLRMPLNFSRISSNFSYARLHPVSHVVKPHLGVDFAAPVGTPVWAVADGTVVSAGRENGGGNTVALRHAMSYETFYLHLDHFGKGVAPGARVEQGQVIGYVGVTGITTGPHLDYRVKKSGQWINPLREKFLPGQPVPKAKLDDYKSWVNGWMKKLGDLPLRLQIAAR